MGRKIPLLILTLTISTLAVTVPNPAVATITSDGATWWTASELLDYYQEVLEEQASLCGGDTACVRQYHDSKMVEVEKYRALANLIRDQFVITAINPKAETIKVLFFDQNAYHKIMGDKISITPLESFYVAWFDDWQGQIFDFDRTQFASGVVKGLHTVYDSIADSLDTANFPTWQEVNISVPESDLNSNTSGKIGFAVFAGNGYSSQGFADYSGCLKDPEYQEGDECRIITTRGKGLSYAPFHIEGEMGSIIPAKEEAGESENNKPAETKMNMPQAPNTGAQVYPGTGYSREINLPWWIAGLILAGFGLIVWWFIPNRKNYPKISKKSVDKNNNLR